MKQHTLSIGAVAFGAVMIGGAAWADCGPIKIASMTWQSAEVTAELDAGPILGQARVPVLPGDSEATRAARVLAQEHRLYPAVLRRFAAEDRTPVLL